MALAVSDIQELQKKAELSRVTRQITELVVLESFVSSNLFSRCFTSCILSRISVKARNGRYFRFSPTDPEDSSLPCTVKQKFIPYLNTRPCLNKKQMLRPLPTPNGLRPSSTLHSPTTEGPGYRTLSRVSNGGTDSLEDILNELKSRLEGLQRRNIYSK